MGKRFVVAWIAVFVAWMAGSFLIHGTLLRDEYAALGSLFRPEAESGALFPFMLLAHVILAGAFVWIYARGVAETPWAGQGLRFGLAIACVSAIPMYTIYYVVQPMPGTLAVRQIVYDGLLLLALGLLVAWLYRDGRRI
jgi:hypothetical protein